jgi:DNA-binding Lrp family transcriptional regulator
MSSVSRKPPKNDVTTILTDNNRNIVKIDNKSRKSPDKQSVNKVKYSSIIDNNNANGNYSNYDSTNFETKNNEMGIISVLDKLNLKIIEELLNNGDIKSSEIASRLKIPLSTVQRRRATLEKFDILKKNYSLDVTKMGLRVAEVSISTKKGSSRKVLDEIYNRHRKYITDMSLRVGNPDTNISFRIVYKNSSRLFNLLEEIKGNQMVDKVDWSEYITEKKNNQSSFSDLLSL